MMKRISMRDLVSEGKNPFTAMAQQTHGSVPTNNDQVNSTDDQVDDQDGEEIYNQGYEAGYAAAEKREKPSSKLKQIGRGIKQGLSIGASPLRGLSKAKDAILGPGKYSTRMLDKTRYPKNRSGYSYSKQPRQYRLPR